MTLEEFKRAAKKKGSDLPTELKKELVKSKFNLERWGKENATRDFYGPTTRSGHIRKYQLTGRLRSSIKGRLLKSKNEVSLILQAGGAGGEVPYAALLEFGGVANFNGTRRRIKPYLFLGKAVQKEQKNLPPFLENFLRVQLEDIK